MDKYQKLILILRSVGSRGVNGRDLTSQHKLFKPAVLIENLKEAGFKIVSRRITSNNTIQYFLLSEPPKPKEKPSVEMTWQVFQDDHGRWVAREVAASTIKKSEQEELI